LKDRAAFADQTLSILSENALVMAQVETNAKDQALKGNLPGAVMNAVVRAMTSHSEIADLLLKDPQTMRAYTSFLFDLLKEGKRIDIDMLESI
jgi:type I restriction enzyme R subunit